MELSKIVTGVILLLVGVILVSALVVPTIAGVQTTTGDPITKTNESLIADRADYYEEDVVVILSTPVGATSGSQIDLTINGYVVPTSDHTLTVPIFMSDSVYLQISSSGNMNTPGIYRINAPATSPINGNFAIGHEYTATFDYSDKLLTLTDKNLSTEDVSTVVEDVHVSFFFSIKENGKYLLTRETAQSGVTAFSEMFVTMPSIDNHTVGIFRDSNSVVIGETTVSYVAVASKYGVSVIVNNEGYSGVGSVTVSGLTLADGTTDIYTGGTPTLTVTIKNDETQETVSKSITPEASWCLAEASGHATSGTAYTLFGLIPLLLFVSLVLVPIGLTAMRSYFGRSD